MQNEYSIKITPSGRATNIKQYVLARGKSVQEVHKRLSKCGCTVHDIIETQVQQSGINLCYDGLTPKQKNRITARKHKQNA